MGRLSYAGKLNKTNTKIWVDSIINLTKTLDIDALFLNLDIQKDWNINLKPETKIKIN